MNEISNVARPREAKGGHRWCGAAKSQVKTRRLNLSELEGCYDTRYFT